MGVLWVPRVHRLVDSDAPALHTGGSSYHNRFYFFSNFEFFFFKSSTVALLPSSPKHFYFSFIFFFSGSVSAIFDLRIFLSRQVPILVSHFHSGTGGFEGSCGAFSLVLSTLLGFF